MNFAVFICLVGAFILSLILGAWSVLKLLQHFKLQEYWTPGLLAYFILVFLSVAYGASK